MRGDSDWKRGERDIGGTVLRNVGEGRRVEEPLGLVQDGFFLETTRGQNPGVLLSMAPRD